MDDRQRAEIVDFIATTSAAGPSGQVGGKLASDILDRLEGAGFAVTAPATKPKAASKGA